MASSQPSDSNTKALSRRQLLKVGAAALGGGLLAAGGAQAQRKPSPTLIVAQGSGLDRVSYATNWYAQAEHGGFYQAVATGIYREHGLDVTIKMGGPGINITQVLAGGAAEFAMGGKHRGDQCCARRDPFGVCGSHFPERPADHHDPPRHPAL